MNPMELVNDYKTLALPLDMIARKHNISLHRCIDILHRATVSIPESIKESKNILKEIN